MTFADLLRQYRDYVDAHAFLMGQMMADPTRQTGEAKQRQAEYLANVKRVEAELLARFGGAS